MKQPSAKSIFIVDDDPMLTESLKDYLTRDIPHEVKTFGTGEVCLQHMHEAPDVIILDYYLNSVDKSAADGMQILGELRKNFPRVHVVMLSSQEHYGVAMKTLIKGAEYYVIKDKDAYVKIKKWIDEI